MKKEIYISFFFSLGIWNSLFSQKTEVEKYFIRVDTAFVSKLKTAYKTSTEQLTETLEIKNDRRINLGFGYQLKDGGKGLGSITVAYQILYFKNRIISYRLSTYIPKKSKKIKKIYKESISKLFEVDKDYNVKPIYFGIDKASEPLPGINKRTDNSVNEIMHPFIGVVYGNYCGSRLNLVKNRELFEKKIAKDNCEYLLYSKNPAIRLMAIEFYYCNLSQFTKIEKLSIDARIKNLYKKPVMSRVCSASIFGKNLTGRIINKLKNCR